MRAVVRQKYKNTWLAHLHQLS